MVLEPAEKQHYSRNSVFLNNTAEFIFIFGLGHGSQHWSTPKLSVLYHRIATNEFRYCCIATNEFSGINRWKLCHFEWRVIVGCNETQINRIWGKNVSFRLTQGYESHNPGLWDTISPIDTGLWDTIRWIRVVEYSKMLIVVEYCAFQVDWQLDEQNIPRGFYDPKTLNEDVDLDEQK